MISVHSHFYFKILISLNHSSEKKLSSQSHFYLSYYSKIHKYYWIVLNFCNKILNHLMIAHLSLFDSWIVETLLLVIVLAFDFVSNFFAKYRTPSKVNIFVYAYKLLMIFSIFQEYLHYLLIVDGLHY
jgi:hypothetical protein